MRGRTSSYRYRALFAGVSASAFVVSGAFSSATAGNSAAQILSPAGLAQIASRHGIQQDSTTPAGPLANPAVQAQIKLSAANLARAAQTLKDQTAAQVAAGAAAQLTLNNAPLSGSGWNGTALSGLNPVNDTSKTLWINADPLHKNTAKGIATVTQTGSNAILTWQSFDLNKGETLVFDQQGHADWTVLNRIVAGPRAADGSRFVASPSYILGSIKADGAVYVINPNGIIFGPNSQINVHSLIASTLDVGNATMTLAERNAFFLNQGITSVSGQNTSFSYDQEDKVLEGDVVVDAGAAINTDLAPRSISPDAGGFVYLIAPNVENDGTIKTPAGEILMLAAQQVQLLANNYAIGGQGSVNPTVVTVPTFRAVGPNLQLNPQDRAEIDPWRNDGVKSAEITAPGKVVNTGLLDAQRGVIILNGDDVTNGALYDSKGVATQVGVISADTSITRNSEIFLDARIKLTVADGSNIQVLPDENGETIPESTIINSTTANPSFVPGSVELSGNTVDIQTGGLIEAPGGTVAINGTPGAATTPNPIAYPDTVAKIVAAETNDLARIYMAPGSTIDVSGLDGVTLPVSDNLVSFKPFGNEFADQPIQRNGALRGLLLTVDIRDSGTIDGVPWIGTPLADVSKLAQNVPLSLDQLLTTGGRVSLTSSRADQIVLRKGSTIDVSGGYVQYQGGLVDTTKLVTAGGQIVNIANANPLETYVGVAGTATVTHPHWGANTTQNFVNPLLSQGVYEPSYVEGHDAGGITLGNPVQASSYALDGTFVAGVIVGERQAASGIRAAAATANTVLAAPTAVPSAGFLSVFGFTNLTVSNDVAALPDDFSITSSLPAATATDTGILASTLTSASFGKIGLQFSGNLLVAQDADVAVVPGGSISLKAGSIDIEGDLTARSGSIALETTSTVANNAPITVTTPTSPNLFDLTIGSGAILDASGMWVNDSGADLEHTVGGAFVDGGAISLKTDTAIVPCASTACKGVAGLGTAALVDITGNIILNAGSHLDLSSGGRIAVSGQFQTDSSGRPVGKGGSLTLETYATGFKAASGLTPTTAFPDATIVFAGAPATASGTAAAIDAMVNAYGFSSGGKLTIQAPSIQVVAGDGPAGPGGAITLPDSFFSSQGFGEYDLFAVVGGLSVAPGAQVALTQRNYIGDASLTSLPTGTVIGSVAGTGYLPEVVRSPTNLVLGSTLAPLPTEPYSPPSNPTALPPEVALSIGAGARIAGDPGASVSLSVTGRILQTVSVDGSLVGNIAPENAVADIEGTISAPAGSIGITGVTNAQIWLGAGSVLDASGVAVKDIRQTAYNIGSVLPGGTVSIVGLDSTTSFIGQAGSQIVVSGAAQTFDIRQDGPSGSSGPTYLPTALWSDAGSVTLTASTLLYDGGIVAKPGAPLANGGTVTVSLPVNNGTLVVQGSGDVVPAALTPTSALTAYTGQAIFQADHLDGSGIANLTLAAGATGGALSPATIQFSGNVTIGGLNDLVLDASVVSLANSPSVASGQCNVCLSANYIAFQGAGSPNAKSGTGILKATAGMIDINAGGSSGSELSFSGVAAADLVSTGDIRLGQAVANLPNTTDPGSLPAGQLIMSGDLTLQAQQVYPVTDIDFTLKALGGNGSITILGNGKPAYAPLSAGGQVTLDAATIDQAGTLLAPLGTIRLGAKNLGDLSPNDQSGLLVVTKTVTLAPGSITSVSLDGLTVPYGQTTDGKNYSYDSNVGLPLSQAPQKTIAVNGDTVDMQTGAKVDLSGGGDIQASEFVQGTGGTRDVLANNPRVFAIIPGYNPKAAPVDPDFITDLGDKVPTAGSSFYLSGMPGLPAGYYTLLPAHYATVPGAYRIEVVSGSQDARPSQNSVLPDGTFQVAGYLANSSAGTRSARTTLFDVQSNAVWRQYSEIDQISGNSYFASLAQSSGSAARLPRDAGHIVVDGTTAMTLDATLQAAPAAGGRGAEFDVAGTDLQILAPGGTAAAGYVGLDVNQLSGLGVDSLLIGGVRSDGTDGETITVTADAVRLSNDAASALSAPEIILAAKAPGKKPAPGAPNGVIVDAGSVIEAKGILAASDPTGFAVHGDGGFLAVSTGAPISVTREGATGTTGLVAIGAGAKIGAAAMTLDAGNITIATGAAFGVGNIAIDSSSIDFGGAPAGTSGLVIDSPVLASLEGADTLSLRSLGAANFYGDVTVALNGANSSFSLDAESLSATHGGTIAIDAGTVTLMNSGTAVSAAPTAGSASLIVQAGEIDLGAGSKTLSGFATATFTGRRQIVLGNTGSLSAGAAALTFDSPLLLVSSGAAQTVTTTGVATIENVSGAAAPAAPGEIGGTFTLTAGAITDNSLIQATAGGVTLEASSGDLTLGSQASIVANGYAQVFFDATRVASGGAVQLIADSGDLAIAKGASVNISSAAGYAGHAGALSLAAAKGTISTGGAAFTTAFVDSTVAGDSGASLSVDAKSIGGTTLTVPSIFSNAIDLHVRQGDFQIVSSLTAQNVTVTADQGTLTIAATVDASGTKGGTIQLFGGQGVTMTAGGQLLATASNAAKRGGDIVIGTEVAADNGSGSDGVIDLGAGKIDVGNTANAANGGTVRLRAPLTASGTDVAIDTVGATITGASSVTVEAFKVFATGSSGFTGVIDPANQGSFYGSCDAQGVCSGTLVDFVQNFALSGASEQKFASIGAGVLHVQPGIELVNNETSINNGDITVASNWNLGAGIAGFLVNTASFKVGSVTVPAGTVVTDKDGALLPQYAAYHGSLGFAQGVSQITKLFYRVGGSPTGEAGTLTLRAAGDVNINASITDGFFQTENRLDPTYLKQVQTWLSNVAGVATPAANNVGGYIIAAADAGNPPPIVPYTAGANLISPTVSGTDPTPIAGADLFPLVADASGPIQGTNGNYAAIASWSYRITAGADTGSADPLAVRPLAVFADGGTSPMAGKGNVTISGHTALSLMNLNSDGLPTSLNIPTIVRTGTGSIDIAAGRDFVLADTKAPGVVYTAGRNSVALQDPGYKMETVADPLNPGRTITVPVATHPDGFLTPQIVACDAGSAFNCNPYGPITQTAYPVGAGHLTVTVQQDILGYQHPTIVAGDGTVQSNQQYYAPWLIAQSTSLSDTEFGVFSSLSAYVANNGPIFTPAQTSWWINFGSFDQGLMSVGGDVRIVAGRDINQLSVSLPTTARVSGGLTATTTDSKGATVANVPVMHLNASGDLTVVAGRDIDSGAFYEGSGQATIQAGGAVQAGFSLHSDPTDPTSRLTAVSTVLAVDTGSISLQARGAIDIAGVVSAVAMHNVADQTGVTNSQVTSTFLSSYGPDSAVTLVSVGGDVTTNSLSVAKLLIANEPVATGLDDVTAYRGVSAYPANFEAVSLRGDITVDNALRLAESNTGTLNLLAYGSLNTDSATNFQNSVFNVADGFQALSTGPSIVEAKFDPTQPLAGFGPAPGAQVLDQGPVLLHQGDSTPDLFYAVTGDIQSGQGAAGLTQAGGPTIFPLSWEITKTAQVHAGQDIIDLPFFGENLAATDVTQIIAGRDIYYTGALALSAGIYPSRPILPQPENAAGLSLGGPGFFDIEAGRNLGPFVTAVADQGAIQTENSTDATGTGIITFGNTVTVGNRLLIDGHTVNQIAIDDPFATGQNFLLPRQGADITALFGVGRGIDYQAVIKADIDPATATSTHNYGSDLVTFLQTLGLKPQSAAQAWTTFQTLAAPLQHVFVEKVFFSELNLAGTAKNFAAGYGTVNTLFPTAYGYTDNGPDGAKLVNQVQTGDLEMLHATIKTLQATSIVTTDPSTDTHTSVAVGGDVMILGPGGNVTVGSQAVEINPFLTASALGILTLDNGVIDTFTDGGLLVNESRVLTVQGGDIILWSSNGDLDAGRGAKTSVDFKPLSVNFDTQDLQTINLNGLVSGAGIGTIQSTPDAPPASAALIAPRGTVNAGDAGLRSSGDLAVIALRVLNAANISSLGAVSGVPQAGSVNLGALESASGTAGGATQAALDSVAAAASRGAQTVAKTAPSIVTVEVLGFGDCDPEAGKKCQE
jgi:filamentous hemagglutinin family protein